MKNEIEIKKIKFGFLRAQIDRGYKFKGFDWDCFAYDGPFLVHYTNLKGLLGIIESDGFWLSDYRFLNDSEEYFNGCRMAKDLIVKISSKPRNKYFSSILGKVFEKLSEKPNKTYFVCSFTKLTDSLEQWRGYANSNDAVAIIFKNKQSLEISHFACLPVFSPQKVIYDDSVKCKRLLRVISKYSIEFRKDLAAGVRIHEDAWSDRLAIDLTEEFMIFKNSAFSAEQEIRLVVSERDISHFKGVKHRVVGGKIIPYISSSDLYDEGFIERNGTKQLPIIEIIVGPTANQIITIDSLKVFLSNSGYPNVNVKPSAVPYRG